MEKKYLYSSINSLLINQFERRIKSVIENPFVLNTKDEIGHTRCIVEIEHQAADTEKIITILQDYEDRWSEIEVNTWLEGSEIEGGSIKVLDLMYSSSFIELDYYRAELFNEGIPTTILTQNTTTNTYYTLQLNEAYLTEAIEILRELAENEGLDAPQNPEETIQPQDISKEMIDNQSSKSSSPKKTTYSDSEIIELLHKEDDFEEILEKARLFEKEQRNDKIQRYIFRACFVAIILAIIIGIFR